MPIFGQKWQFWAKFGNLCSRNPIFYRRKQKTQRKTIYVPCLRCFLVGHGTKWIKNAIIFSQQCQGRFLAKKHFLGGGSKTFGIPISGNQWDSSFVLKTSWGSNWSLGTKCAILTLKFEYLRPKVNFCFEIAILVNRTNHQCTWGYNYPIGSLLSPVGTTLRNLWYNLETLGQLYDYCGMTLRQFWDNWGHCPQGSIWPSTSTNCN